MSSQIPEHSFLQREILKAGANLNGAIDQNQVTAFKKTLESIGDFLSTTDRILIVSKTITTLKNDLLSINAKLLADRRTSMLFVRSVDGIVDNINQAISCLNIAEINLTNLVRSSISRQREYFRLYDECRSFLREALTKIPD